MAPSKKPSPKKPSPKKPALPAALRDRAEAASKAAQARHLRDARAALARAKTALETAEAGLYEVALALRDLSDARLLAALGEKSVYTAAATHLGLSRSTVERLRRAVEAVDAERFAALGHMKVNAMLELADATPADDTEAILAERAVPLWEGGPTIDVKASSVKDLRGAAAQARAHSAETTGGSRRGNRVKPAEVALARALTETLAAHGVTVAAKARATRVGSPARYDLQGLDEGAVLALVNALSKKRR
jgi:hypothetical protein